MKKIPRVSIAKQLKTCERIPKSEWERVGYKKYAIINVEDATILDADNKFDELVKRIDDAWPLGSYFISARIARSEGLQR